MEKNKIPQILCKAVLSNAKKGGVPVYQLVPKERKSISYEEFIAAYARRIGEDKTAARYFLDTAFRLLCGYALQNRKVNIQNLRLFLTVKGSLTGATAKLDPAKNPVSIAVVPSGDLKAAVAGIIAVNDTLTVEAALYSVHYEDSEENNTIEGTGLIKLNGKGLKLTGDNADEGIWLENPTTGEILTNKATIVDNDEATVDITVDDFADIPEELTKVRLVVMTRNGESKDDYGVVRLERLLTVVRA